MGAGICFAALVAACAALLAVGTNSAGAQDPAAVVLNEILAANDTVLADEDGDFEDWIELHNTGTDAIDISGWTLTDDPLDPTMWEFPAGVTLAAGDYLVVFASNKDRAVAGSNLHTNFKLSGSGEYLGLRTGDGTLVDEFEPTYPPQLADISWGRTGIGDELGFFADPSPGAANSGDLVLSDVVFGVEHGIFDASFSLSLSSAENATIKYTLDGSEPTDSNGLTYSGAIFIDETTVVRARAVSAGASQSRIVTQTYLFLDDVVQQDSTPPGWPTSDINGQVMNFGMDPEVVDDDEQAVIDALESIPTLSMVTDLDNLFDPTNGIYVNAQEQGRDWERPGSLELIDPSGAEAGFEANVGIRIRGGFSRRDANPKHAFRLFFRSEYGTARLNYPLFGDEGVDEFEKVDLRTAQNYSWSGTGEDSLTLLRERWSRETQAAMGHPYTRSRYYHLYVNGQYFGIFMTQERVSADYAESYLGGDDDDYDVVKHNRDDGYRAEATDGDLAAWQSLWPLISDTNVTNAEYVQIAADVDLVNLADFYLLHTFSGDFDGATSWFLSIDGDRYVRGNNWYATRNRNGGQWQFYDHDSEHSLCIRQGGPSAGVSIDNTAIDIGADNPVWNVEYFNPGWLHAVLISNDNYRQLFQDRVQRHLLNADGALTTAANTARIDALSAVVGPATLAESARWGDSRRDTPRGPDDWAAEVDYVRNTCLQQRTAVVVPQLQADGLVPTLDPPVIGGQREVASGTSIPISNPNSDGSVWYTTNGLDPRGIDDTPIADAANSGSVTIDDYVTVTARVRDGGSWSAPVTATFSLSSLPADPVILLNEYNAVAADELLDNDASDETFGRILGNGGDWFELVVVGDDVDLRGWQLELWSGEGDARQRRDLFVIANNPLLSSVPAGTLITVAEDQPDSVNIDPAAGQFAINLQANDADDGAFITADSQQNFDTNADDWALVIRDSNGAVATLRTGEGSGALTGVGPREVGKLEATPSPATRPTDASYDDGTTSTFGLANRWNNEQQDLGGLRNLPPVLTSLDDQLTQRFATVDLLVAAADDEPGLSWVADGLPAGLSIDDDGRITGLATVGGTSEVTITVTDVRGLAVSVVFDWRVNLAPQVSQFADRTDEVGTQVGLGIVTQDGDNDEVLLTVAGLPPGIEFSGTTSILGTLTDPGSYDVTVTASDGFGGEATSDFVWTVTAAAEPTATIAQSCLSENGRLDIILGNTGTAATTMDVVFGTLGPRTRTVAPGDTTLVTITGRPDGTFPLVVSADGVTVLNQSVTIGCDAELEVAVSCLAGRGRIDVLLSNRSAGSVTYAAQIGQLAIRTTVVAPGDDGRITVTGRGEGPIDVRVLRNGLEISDESVFVDCVPAGPEARVAVSCLAGNGRIDVILDNPSPGARAYVVTIGGLPPRTITVGGGSIGQTIATGRPDGQIPVTVTRAGSPVDVAGTPATVACDAPPVQQGDEVVVSVGCLGGNGRVDVSLLNITEDSVVYSVGVGSLSPRTRAMGPDDRSTVTITGRADGSLDVIVSRDNTEIWSSTETIACD